MIFALILILLVIIFLAFFVGKNLSNLCTFWFFKTYSDLPVTVIVFIAFAAGIIFSLLCYLVGKLIRTAQNEREAEIKSLTEKQKKAHKKMFAKEKKTVETPQKTTDKENSIVDKNNG